MRKRKLTQILVGTFLGVLTLAEGRGAKGATRGILDGKRPHDAVQLVGQRGHVLVPETDKVTNRWVFEDGVLTASPLWDSLVTPDDYQDFRLHVEFNVNEVPGVDPEKNGNSGIYIQQRYELQILNSHGIPEEEYTASYAGSLYRQKKPDKLVSKPAGEWQTYDIVFRAARFADGKKTEKARITVKHNGVLIHDDYALTNKTGAGKKEGPEPGPIKFQGHHNPVKFRNVWIQRLDLDAKEEEPAEKEKKKGYTYVVPFEDIPPAPFLSPDEALKSFRLHEDFEISTVVHEPEVQSPLALRFDGDGRMWVVEMRGYMLDADGTDEAGPHGRISIHEDTDGDGFYDSSSVFLDGLNQPRSIAFYKGGVLYGGHEKLYFVENNDGKAGQMTVIDENYTQDANVEHRTNALLRGLDNWIYNVKSDTRYREIDGRWVKEKTAFRGQWGMSYDDYGRLYYNENWFGIKADQLLPNTLRRNRNFQLNRRDHGRHLSYRDKLFPARITPGVNRGGEGAIDEDGYLTAATGAAGPLAYRGDQFPPQFQNTGLFCEPAAHLVRMVHVHREQGLSAGEHLLGEREFLASTDERFRPVNLFNAPDGTVYLVDMYHGIIQHKHYLTRYLREHIEHRDLESRPQGGRIYRIKSKENPRGGPPRMLGKKPTELVPFLSHPNGWWRDTAQQLIVDFGSSEVVPGLTALATRVDQPLGQIHALWCLEGLGQVNESAIKGALKSSDSFVLESAIRLSAQLPEEERAALMPTFVRLAGEGDLVVRRELAASLGRIPGAGALSLLKEILIAQASEPYFREAAISGLEGREGEFLAVLGEDFQDAEFRKYLEHCLTPKTTAAAYKPPRDKEHLASFKRGEQFYLGNCMACHGPDGAGMELLGPPLVKSEWVTESPQRLSAILLQGLMGPIDVQGETYRPAAAMPGLKEAPHVTDEQLADVATFVRHAWNNRKGQVKAETVTQVREELEGRQAVFTPEELKQDYP